MILYAVTVSDYNGNSKLDDKDPVYLFTSNLSGKNFKQISPNKVDARSFQPINGTETILIQAISDTNKDKKFGEGDEVIPMIFHASRNSNAKKVFSDLFDQKINNELNIIH